MSCCLERDLEILPKGDQTEIGERGVNLSGGQKARISLARAVYADRDIILMDDPISALDSNTRKKIFKRGFKDMLNGKTRVLCTHAIDFLHLADRVVVIKKGEIVVQGEYSDVKDHPSVQEIINIHDKNAKEKKEALTNTNSSENVSLGLRRANSII
jgi:ABC-type bacteriocin/lantibiotic exporter with double-glycine peptidase domain